MQLCIATGEMSNQYDNTAETMQPPHNTDTRVSRSVCNLNDAEHTIPSGRELTQLRPKVNSIAMVPKYSHMPANCQSFAQLSIT